MEPIGVWVRKNGEWALIHRCKRCGNPTVVRKFKGVLDVYKRQALMSVELTNEGPFTIWLDSDEL